MTPHAPAAAITTQRFLEDPHAVRYRDVVENHPYAFAQVVSDPQ